MVYLFCTHQASSRCSWWWSVWPQVHVPLWGYDLQTEFADRRRLLAESRIKADKVRNHFFPFLFIAIVFHTIFSAVCFVGTLFRHFLFADLHLLIQLLWTWWSRQHLPWSPNTSSAAVAQKCAKCAKLREFLFVLGLTAQGEVVYRSRWYLIRFEGRFRGHCYSLCRNRVVLDLLLKEFSFMLRNFIPSLNGVTNPPDFFYRGNDSRNFYRFLQLICTKNLQLLELIRVLACLL